MFESDECILWGELHSKWEGIRSYCSDCNEVDTTLETFHEEDPENWIDIVFQ